MSSGSSSSNTGGMSTIQANEADEVDPRLFEKDSSSDESDNESFYGDKVTASVSSAKSSGSSSEPAAKKRKVESLSAASKKVNPDADKPGDAERMGKYNNPMELFIYDLENKFTDGSEALNKEKQFNMLFSLLCGLAGSTIVKGVELHLWDIWGKAEEEFNNVLDSFPKKSEWFDKIWQFLPGQKWPTAFYVEGTGANAEQSYIYRKKHPKTFYKEFMDKKKLDVDHQELQRYHFGYRVWKEFLEASSYCVNKINKHWPDQLPSGVSYVQMLLRVRSMLIPDECRDATVTALKQKMKPKPAVSVPAESIEVIDLNTPEENVHVVTKKKEKVRIDTTESTYQVKYQQQLLRFNLSWYPDCWLCFVYLGKASERPMAKFVAEASSNAFDKKNHVKDEHKFKLQSATTMNTNVNNNGVHSATSSPQVIVVERKETSMYILKEKVKAAEKLHKLRPSVATEEKLAELLQEYLLKLN